jgi:hypothetical protein
LHTSQWFQIGNRSTAEPKIANRRAFEDRKVGKCRVFEVDIPCAVFLPDHVGETCIPQLQDPLLIKIFPKLCSRCDGKIRTLIAELVRQPFQIGKPAEFLDIPGMRGHGESHQRRDLRERGYVGEFVTMIRVEFRQLQPSER